MPIHKESLNVYDLIEIDRGPIRHWCIYIGSDPSCFDELIEDNKYTIRFPLCKKDGEQNYYVAHFFPDRKCAVYCSTAGSSENRGGFRNNNVRNSSNSVKMEMQRRGKVTIEKLEDVLGRHVNVRVNNLTEEARKRWLHVLPNKEIKRNILEALKSHKDYHVFSENCEHFVTTMKYGEGFSSQVNKRWTTVKYIGRWCGIAIVGFIGVLIIIGTDWTRIFSRDDMDLTIRRILEDIGKIKEKVKL